MNIKQGNNINRIARCTCTLITTTKTYPKTYYTKNFIFGSSMYYEEKFSTGNGYSCKNQKVSIILLFKKILERKIKWDSKCALFSCHII